MKTKKHYIFNWIQRKLSAFVLLYPIFIHGIWSQNQPLDINQCYTIALENSPKLQTKILDILSNDVLIEQAKMQFLPSLNAGATHGYNWGQSIDPFTNTFATGRVRTNNFSVRSTWEIFTGLMKRYNLSIAQLNRQTSEEIFHLERRNFKNEIASVYAKLQTDYLLKSLYSEQYQLIQTLYANVSAQEKVGRRSPFDKLRIQALMQQDSALIVAADNTIKYTEFVLHQMLNEPDSLALKHSFEILSEKQMIEQLRKFTNWEIDTLQEMRVARLNRATAELEYKIAKSQAYPVLTLNSAVGSGYSGRNQELVGTTLVTKPMNEQLRENLFQTAVLTLSIPIFNNYRVKNAMKLAAIKMQQADLEILQTRIDLINYIERLLLDYENESVNMRAKKQVLKTNQELFVASEKMFSNGILNYAEFVEAKYAVTQAHLDYFLTLSKCYGILLILENIIA
jgi:outer membrane protein